MKNNKFYLLAALFTLFIFFSSCSEQDNEPNLEGNLDVWLEKNKENLQDLDRKTITSFPIEYQKAIMRELKPEKRKDIWKDKVRHILSLDLSKEELEYLS